MEGLKMENIKLINAENVENIELIGALKELEIIEDIEDIQEIDAKNNMIILDNNQEYLYFINYEDAEATAVQYCVDIIQDCGVSENLLNIAINHNMVDLSWFMDAATEYAENYAYNESIEYLADAEELEQIDAGIVSEDELREKYYNSILPSNAEGAFDEFIYQFGRDYTIEIIKKYDLLNYEELAQYCVDVDGVGHFLSSYDGEELEYNNYYLYRVN